MHEMDDPTRRRFLGVAGLGLAALAVGCKTGDDGVETEIDTDPGTEPDTDSGIPDCPATTPDIEGPFYRSDAPIRNDLDLYGDEGTRLMLSGVVLGADCEPLRNAVIEIWHCNTPGAYDNETAEKRYRGQAAVDAEGRYWFETIKPGWYLNGAQYRPAHIHVKVWHDGVERLTTQLYFEGDPYLDIDPWAEESRTMPVSTEDDGSMTCVYDFAV